MPLHYGSQIEEHNVVRSASGMFDVSHMTVVDVTGPQSKAFLQRLLANDVDKLAVVGKALYSAMLNEAGGVIDDLIVYLCDDGYRLVVNCATRDKDLAWMSQQVAGFDAQITERPELAMVAVQGPKARAVVNAYFGVSALDDLSVFQGMDLGSAGREQWFVARTGYTGEDGYEIILPSSEAEGFWRAMLDAGVTACGLGARDTLRLEAGMNLYGHEMDENISPLVANMAWTVAWTPADRNFVGRPVIEAEKAAGVTHKLVGLVLETKGVLRAGQTVHCPALADSDAGSGIITSGTFSPTLGYSVAMARVPVSFAGACEVEVRNKRLPVTLVKPSFVRHGEKV